MEIDHIQVLVDDSKIQVLLVPIPAVVQCEVALTFVPSELVMQLNMQLSCLLDAELRDEFEFIRDNVEEAQIQAVDLLLVVFEFLAGLSDDIPEEDELPSLRELSLVFKENNWGVACFAKEKRISLGLLIDI